MIFLSGANFCDTKSYLKLSNLTRLESQDNLVMLGFAFGTRPNADAHVYLIKKNMHAMPGFHVN